jgi:fumarylacetoacetate (FAA) hydrolase
MKLASLKSGGRDGTLVVVSRDLTRAVSAEHAGARTLQAALDDWARLSPKLAILSLDLEHDELDSFPLDPLALAAPLPRAYQWLDGSAYLSHVERIRKSRGEPMPPDCLVDPLMFQAGSGAFFGPRDCIRVADEDWGVDFEAELAVVTGDVPMGISVAEAGRYIRLLMLANDVTLRTLVACEANKGSGFVHAKPGCAFSPVAVTPDELGAAWDGGRLSLTVVTHWNGVLFGRLSSGLDLQFDFANLISHAARTRALPAGTLVGSGTISNVDTSAGYACILERRVVESELGGSPVTPYMRHGDRIRIDALDAGGSSVFGTIEAEVRVHKSA